MRRFITIPRLWALLFAVLIPALVYTTGLPSADDYRGKYRGHGNLGTAYQKAGRIAEAKEQYRMALKKNPYYSEAYVNMGTILEIEGAVSDAVLFYREALKFSPDMAVAHYNLGNALVRLDRFDEAVVEFHETIRLGFLPAQSHNNAGYVRANQKRYSEARAEFEAALKAEPGNFAATQNLILLSKL